MVQNVAEREQRIIDLKKQLTELEGQDQAEVVFQSVRSPGREPITLWNLQTGERIVVPRYVARAALKTGRFSTREEDAPPYKIGNVKCFLAADSPERPVLQEIGLGDKFCPADKLQNLYARRMHGMKKHRQEWAALQEHVEAQKQATQEARANAQLEATLALAGKAAQVEEVQCDLCDYTGTKNQVRGHRMGAHK